MSTGLDAIYEELKRLQLEGMNRVFIEDSTVALLQPLRQKQPEASARPTVMIDLPTTTKAPDLARPAAPDKAPAPKTKPLSEPAPTVELPEGDAATQLQWLQASMENSPVCQEHLREGEQVVFGSGATDATILFCGEAPDENDATSGQPFSGKAGELLTKILRAMGLERDAVYMTHILKWRPEHDKPYGNRPPTQAEMNYCLPYLKAQIEIIQPKVIVALGNATLPGLLGPDPDRKMATIRGSWQSLDGTPLIFTFQPSYLLFNDTLKTKRIAWEDMLKVMQEIGLSISEKQQNFFLPK
jgi:uracil-DNA glycosylase family 4